MIVTTYITLIELPLIRTPEMWPPLYSGDSEKSQSIIMLDSTNSNNHDTLTGPKGGRSLLYIKLAWTCQGYVKGYMPVN